MKFNNTEVWGFRHAIRGMRSPMNSRDKSDSDFDDSKFSIGENDLRLAQRLIKAGSEHRKFMRQIFVSVDITAPLYWWKEFDTYKVGTVSDSTSTMHKLASTPITLDCFETDDYEPGDIQHIVYEVNGELYYTNDIEQTLIPMLEDLRMSYIETKDKSYWKELIRWLPESWLQRRTVTMSYENIYSMVHQRKNHKLNEWSGCDNPELPNFISWAKTLPYAQNLLFVD